jgi:hypothetical protein
MTTFPLPTLAATVDANGISASNDFFRGSRRAT